MSFDRREILKLGAAAGAAVVACRKAPAIPPPEPRTPPARSRVVVVRDAEVIDEKGALSRGALERMLDQGVTALLGESDPVKAWARVFKSGDVLGIKTNRWRFLRTPVELEQALKARAIAAGVAPADIAVDDQGVLGDPVFQRSTALVNVRPLRTHDWAGIGSCLKNYIMFDPVPSRWHDDACANLAGLWDLPAVKGKTRLNILVVLTPLFHGKGPHHFQADYTWPYRGLILGHDPVAVDATGVRLLEAKRREFFKESLPFAVSPHHVNVAESRYGLGVADPARIDLVKIGWTEGALI
jgi:hypothetical protein